MLGRSSAESSSGQKQPLNRAAYLGPEPQQEPGLVADGALRAGGLDDAFLRPQAGKSRNFKVEHPLGRILGLRAGLELRAELPKAASQGRVGAGRRARGPGKVGQATGCGGRWTGSRGRQAQSGGGRPRLLQHRGQRPAQRLTCLTKLRATGHGRAQPSRGSQRKRKERCPGRMGPVWPRGLDAPGTDLEGDRDRPPGPAEPPASAPSAGTGVRAPAWPPSLQTGQEDPDGKQHGWAEASRVGKARKVCSTLRTKWKESGRPWWVLRWEPGLKLADP